MRRSSRRKAAVAAAAEVNNAPDKLWCSCQQPEKDFIACLERRLDLSLFNFCPH